ncbi:MAG: YezD family protein [Desulfuromonadales bacterium]|nr:YezD family protein [Desulfuromonadales bacterium]
MEQTQNDRPADLWNPEIEKRLRQAIRDIRYGSVTLVIQDGHVVQIDKSEKVRLK